MIVRFFLYFFIFLTKYNTVMWDRAWEGGRNDLEDCHKPALIYIRAQDHVTMGKEGERERGLGSLIVCR